jgi:hypothetical protein
MSSMPLALSRRSSLALGCAAILMPLRAAAQTAMPSPPKLPPQPTAGEAPFVARLQQSIPPRFASLAAAERAGYFQYTPEDETGAISYVNMKIWNGLRLELPNQLWYDVNGKLLGADYTIFESVSAQPPPKLFGFTIERGRWVRRGAHIHYGFALPDGSLKFGALTPQKFRDAGGTLTESQYQLPANKPALVSAGIDGLTRPGQVKFVFLHPAMWDLVVWVLPNPDGAWADANPNVKPSAHAAGH